MKIRIIRENKTKLKEEAEEPQKKLGQIASNIVSKVNDALADPEYDMHQFGKATYHLLFNLSAEGFPITARAVEGEVDDEVNNLVDAQAKAVHNDRLQQDEEYRVALTGLSNQYSSFKVPIQISSFVRTGGEVDFSI